MRVEWYSHQFYDDIQSKQWTNWTVKDVANLDSSFESQTDTNSLGLIPIYLTKSSLNDSQFIVANLGRELVRVGLQGQIPSPKDSEMEPIFDLASVYFGFGLFMANTVHRELAYWKSPTLFLKKEHISYTSALLCIITNATVDRYGSFLSASALKLFKQDFEYLQTYGARLLTPSNLTVREEVNKVGNLIARAQEERKFDEIFSLCVTILEIDSKNLFAINAAGYALMMQKDYAKAIQYFDSAFELDSFWYTPLNFRGLCKLKLGELDSAFVDLHGAFEMSYQDSYTWRNLGVYYLLTKELDKAKLYFEEANRIQPKTEMINMCLAKAHRELGNIELSMAFEQHALENNEIDDGLLD